MSIAICTIDDVGAFSDLPRIDVTDGTPVSHTLSTGKKGVLFINSGQELCWYGGATIDADILRGLPMIPMVYFPFRNASPDFKIYFQCATGLATTVSVVEYA